MMGKPAPAKSQVRCGFCGKDSDKVKKLISGGDIFWLKPPLPEVIICNECVELCMEVLADKDQGWRDRQIERLRKMAEPPEDDQNPN